MDHVCFEKVWTSLADVYCPGRQHSHSSTWENLPSRSCRTESIVFLLMLHYGFLLTSWSYQHSFCDSGFSKPITTIQVPAYTLNLPNVLLSLPCLVYKETVCLEQAHLADSMNSKINWQRTLITAENFWQSVGYIPMKWSQVEELCLITVPLPWSSHFVIPSQWTKFQKSRWLLSWTISWRVSKQEYSNDHHKLRAGKMLGTEDVFPPLIFTQLFK